MFFLQNGRGDNKSPILSSHSYTRYLESSSGLFHLLLTFFTTDCHFFGFHNIDNDTFPIQNHILLLLKLHIYNTRKYGFLSFNNFVNEISKIKNLERRIAVNKWNICEIFRKK